MKKHAFNIFKICAIVTFSVGVLLHGLNLLYGQEYFLEHILTPIVDKIFSIPMALAGIFSWLALAKVYFKKKLEKSSIYFNVYLLDNFDSGTCQIMVQ